MPPEDPVADPDDAPDVDPGGIAEPDEPESEPSPDEEAPDPDPVALPGADPDADPGGVVERPDDEPDVLDAPAAASEPGPISGELDEEPPHATARAAVPDNATTEKPDAILLWRLAIRVLFYPRGGGRDF